ncbi:MAG: T9SS type A sorting domain-containing protein [Candidatus Coatesbacteria bacterium]|nr:T9SS type A sorting domain-containing protein [Candidatus Coatesbacteria bacterium]
MKALNLVIMLVMAVVALGDTWMIETVDADGNTGRFTSLAIDDSGNSHISYYKHSSSDLMYAAWNGSSWDIEAVDTTGEVGKYSSLELDSSDHPCIAYQDSANADLKYAAWNGASWEIETVDSDGWVGDYTSLALDSSGNPHISYYDRSNSDLKYAVWNGASWDIETIGSANALGLYCSLELDDADHPHISHYFETAGDLFYTTTSGSTWLTMAVDVDYDVGLYTSLALSSTGNPSIAYYDWTNDLLKYASWNGVSWDLETVENVNTGLGVSLILDDNDNPHISYIDENTMDLKHAAWNGSSWDIETVDSQDNVGYDSSIALDDFGNPHISYLSVTGFDLKHAVLNQSPTAFSLLSPADGATVDDYPLCDWEDSTDPESETITYDLWYSTEADFDPHEELTGLIDSEYQFSDAELDPDTTYHWKVVATDGYEETWSSETWSFYVPDDVGLDGVELAAAPEDDGMLLGWSISGDLPAGVRVLRGVDDPVAVSGSLDGTTRRWLDRDVSPGGSYVYWIEATDSAGQVQRFGPTAAVVVPEQTQRLALDEPYPNPANSRVSVAFTLPQAQRVSLSVYDLAGRRVAVLSEGELPAGRHTVNWNCAAAAAGVYLLRLETQGAALSRRVVVGRVVGR